MTGWQSETGSVFQRQDYAYWNERFVIFKEEPVGGGATATTEDEGVQIEERLSYTETRVDWL